MSVTEDRSTLLSPEGWTRNHAVPIAWLLSRLDDFKSLFAEHDFLDQSTGEHDVVNLGLHPTRALQRRQELLPAQIYRLRCGVRTIHYRSLDQCHVLVVNEYEICGMRDVITEIRHFGIDLEEVDQVGISPEFFGNPLKDSPAFFVCHAGQRSILKKTCDLWNSIFEEFFRQHVDEVLNVREGSKKLDKQSVHSPGVVDEILCHDGDATEPFEIANSAKRASFDSIAHLDFQLRCETTRVDIPGFQCPSTAVAYVEWHKPGHCKMAGLTQAGNQTGTVCLAHLEELRQVSARAIANSTAQIPPSQRERFRPECGSCGMPIKSIDDIVQKVVML